MSGIEQKITTLEKTNSKLVEAVNRLTSHVTGKIQEIDSRVKAKEDLVDKFLADAQPEHRYVQDITIGGSKDYFYPVWWRFPRDYYVNSYIGISRDFNWNGDVGERPLNKNSLHQAGLNLIVEGNGWWSDGSADFMEIKRFYYTYNNVISHLSLKMYCKAEPIDPLKPMSQAVGNGSFGKNGYMHSGIYLRGGGIKYRITTNKISDFHYHDGSDDKKRIILEQNNTRCYAEPIPITDKIVPDKTISAYPGISDGAW